MARRKSSFARNFSKWRKSADRQRKSFVKSFSRTKKAAVKATKKAARKYGPRPKRPAKYGYKTVFRKGAAITRDVYVGHEESGAPRLALIINARRGAMGLPGLYGGAMRDAIDREYKFRIGAVNFLRAGWLSTVAILAKACGEKPGANAIQFLSRFGAGGPWGGATAAQSGWNPTAEFYNMAFSRHTSTDRGKPLAEEGLTKAIAQETKSMGDYIAKKMEERSRKAIDKFLKF